MNTAYWVLLIVFGLLGVWHALTPVALGQEYRTGLAALVLYIMLCLIGLRYFMFGLGGGP